MSLAIKQIHWATVVDDCVARANSIIDLDNGAQNMSKTFLRDVMIRLSNQVFTAKLKETKEDKDSYAPPSAEMSYNAALGCYDRLFQKKVSVVVGGLTPDAPYDYAQADIEKDTIHLNCEWINKAQTAFVENTMSAESRRQKAVIVVKLLHEYIHLYTRTLVELFYTQTGRRVTIRSNFNTPKKVGRKMLPGGKWIGYLGFAGEEVLVNGRLQLQFTRKNVFVASMPLVLIDSKRNAWEFVSDEQSNVFIDTLLASALDNTTDYNVHFAPVAGAIVKVGAKKSCKRKLPGASASSSSKATKKSASSSAKKGSSEESEVMAADDDTASSTDYTWSWRHLEAAPSGSRKS